MNPLKSDIRIFFKFLVTYLRSKIILLALDFEKFKNFLVDMGERPENKTLDRIDVDGNYEPSNCRWATLSEQQKNKRCHKKC